MSLARKHWNAMKADMEVAFGKDVVKKSFSLDLGPTFDEMDKNCDKLDSQLDDMDKLIQEIRKTGLSMSELRRLSGQKLTAYEKIIIEHSKASKTQHGAQIGAMLNKLQLHADKRPALIQARIAGAVSAMDALRKR